MSFQTGQDSVITPITPNSITGCPSKQALTNVVIIASTTMELNMVFVRSTNHGVTNITGQNMLAIVTHLAITKKLSTSHLCKQIIMMLPILCM